MKKLLLALAFGVAAFAAQAEASFEQIQTLIQQHNYSAAEKGLEEIIKNHPKSAKAFYAMAQTQAGLGNQEKARKALDIATGLNPTLDFVPESSVRNLKEAITPQIGLIEPVEESHTFRNFMIFLVLGIGGFAVWYGYKEHQRSKEEEAKEKSAREAQWAKEMDEAQARHDALKAERAEARRKEEEAEAALRAHKNYGHERFDPSNPDKLKSVKQFKEEQAAAEPREANARAERAEMDARLARSNASSGPAYAQPAPTVVQNSSNDMLTGVLIGNMISNMGHSHDTERTVVRETVREVPAPSRDSSWDDTPSTPSRSSTWDDTPSTPSRDSSWDDDSSSKKSSSWSDSSSSSSSSSWDSGSSDSSSSSSSDSSW